MNIKPWIPFCKEFFSEQWAKISCYGITLLRVIKNEVVPVNFSTHKGVWAQDTETPVGNMYL